MKAIKLAGMLSLAIAAVAMAQHGTVNWTVADGSGGGPYTAGDVVAWNAAVDLTTDGNKGLGVYTFDISVVDSGNVEIGNVVSAANFTNSFNALGNAKTKAKKLTQDSSIGGLTMNGAQDAGFASAGHLTGVGAGFGSPWTGNGLSGVMQPGVGFASRKVTYNSDPANGLLADGVSAFVMNDGTIPTTGLAPGLYTVKLVPNEGAHNVLAVTNINGTIDYSSNFSANYQISASLVHGDNFVFEIVPEPATLLLVAGGIAAFARRRRTA